MEKNNQIFKGSREQHGDNFVTYGGIELVAFNKLDRGANLSFDWGNSSNGSEALAYAILDKVGSKNIASRYAKLYMKDVILKILKDEWTIESILVVRWINQHTNYSIDETAYGHENTTYEYNERREEERRKDERRIKRESDFKEEAQRRLKLYEEKEKERREEDRRTIERRINPEPDFQEELNNYKKRILKQNLEIEAYKIELNRYKLFVESLDIKEIYKKYLELDLEE